MGSFFYFSCMKYEIKLRVPLAAVSKTVEGLETSLNETMKGFGYDDPLKITAVTTMTLTTDRELDLVEKGKITDIVEATAKEKFGYGKVEKFTFIND